MTSSIQMQPFFNPTDFIGSTERLSSPVAESKSVTPTYASAQSIDRNSNSSSDDAYFEYVDSIRQTDKELAQFSRFQLDQLTWMPKSIVWSEKPIKKSSPATRVNFEASLFKNFEKTRISRKFQKKDFSCFLFPKLPNSFFSSTTRAHFKSLTFLFFKSFYSIFCFSAAFTRQKVPCWRL